MAASESQEDEKASALTRAELALLLAAVPAEWRLFFEFLAHTGLRISEAIGLTWRHLDLGTSPRVLVREQFYEGERQRLKSRHSRRELPLSGGMAERLRALLGTPTRGEGTSVHVCRQNGAKPLQHRNAVPEARSGGDWARVEGNDGKPTAWPSFRTLRHTCASLLFGCRQECEASAGVAWAR